MASKEAYLNQPYLKIWKFSGQQDFKTAHVIGQVLVGDHFQFDRSGVYRFTSQAQNSRCSDLLAYSQTFPLSVMQEYNYVPQNWIDALPGVSKRLHPDQMTISEVSQLITQREMLALQLPLMQQGKTLIDFLGYPKDTYAEERLSTFWMASGQIISPEKSESLTPMPLYWQTHETYVGNPLLEIDRSIHPYIWEFGRGAKKQDFFDKNMRALTIQARQEHRELSRVYGEGDGFVFIHCSTEDRSEHFQENYGFQIYTRSEINPQGSVLMIPLKELLRRYPPSELSGQVQALRSLTNDRLTDDQTLEVSSQSINLFRTTLDWRWKGQESPTPLLLEDLSLNSYRIILEGYLKGFGLNALQITRLKVRLMDQAQKELIGSRRLRDSLPIQNGWSRLIPSNAVHISNLDVEMIEDSNYIPTVLAKTLEFYIQRLKGFGIVNGEAFLKEQNVRICVRTSVDSVWNKLKSRGAESFDNKIKNLGIQVGCFSIHQIQQMTIDDSASLSEGGWSAFENLQNPRNF